MPGRWSGWQNAICFKVFLCVAANEGAVLLFWQTKSLQNALWVCWK